jgi:2-dehydropantoate 2-reductase
VALTTGMFAECSAIAAANGHAPSQGAIDRSYAMFTALTSPIAASMLRDIERGAPIEADHVVGNLLQRAKNDANSYPLLRIAYAHLKAYEARRKRETPAATA